MSPRASLWLAGGLAAGVATYFAYTTRLPLPFPGFSVLAAAGLAGLGTLALLAWMPRTWVFSDAELLRQDFQALHGLTETSAEVALDAITTAHGRADSLRRAAGAMRDDIAEQVRDLADKLDGAAREIFYVPRRGRDLGTVLVRSRLIEDAAVAHAALRKRKHGPTEDASREKLVAALEALEAAFEQTDLKVARGLLQDVEIASSVAERVLTPPARRRGDTH